MTRTTVGALLAFVLIASAAPSAQKVAVNPDQTYLVLEVLRLDRCRTSASGDAGMEHRLHGRTGVRVSPLCLGAMNLGCPTPEDESIRIVHAALDAGVSLIDTAMSTTTA